MGVALTAGHLQAQEVIGRVVDDATGTPTERAIVEILDAEDAPLRSALTDSNGRFRIALSEAGGPFTLVVWAMSYHPARVDTFHVQARRTLDLGEIRLEAAPIALDSVRAEGLRTLTGRERIRQRQLLGRGTFLSGAVIEAARPYSLTEYVAEAAGILVRYRGRSPHRARAADDTRSRQPRILQGRVTAEVGMIPRLLSPEAPRDCMHITVNHWPLANSGYRSLDEIPLSWIAAVEVYNTPWDVPEEAHFAITDFMFDGCGILNVWLWNSW